MLFDVNDGESRHQWCLHMQRVARAGLIKQFLPGVPCRNGHWAYWYANGGCRQCSDERKKAWVMANPEKAKGYGQKHYRENADAYKARAKRWKEENPDAARASAKSRTPNVEARRASEKRRREAFPEKYREKARVHRHRRRQAIGTFTQADVAWILKKQKNTCAYCPTKLTSENQELDHIRPLARGGTNHRWNLQMLCRPCNRRKGAKDALDFAREKGLLL